MPLLRTVAIALLAEALALATSIGPAAPCVPATLDVYMLLPSAGCTIADHVKVMDFEFEVVDSMGVSLDPDDILVTPVTGMPDYRYGLNFSSSAFSVSGADFITFQIRYIFDPADIRSLEDVMRVASPVAPGLAQIDTFGCLGFGYTPGCAGSEVHLVVSHNGITFIPVDQAAISPPQTILGIRNVIDLQANGASADFDSIENAIYLPEPATWVTVLAGSAVLVLRRRFR
jgi:hypothetical protein